MDKNQAQYEVPAKAQDTCAQCKHFNRDKNTCTVVEGSISAQGWCKEFSMDRQNFMDEFYDFAKGLADRD